MVGSMMLARMTSSGELRLEILKMSRTLLQTVS
jgi:hypothetical protein